MQLILNTPGVYLHCKEGMFRIKTKEEVHQVFPKKIESILVSTAATLSTGAIKLAMDHNIDIVFLDKFGNPYGRVWHSKLGSTTLIRRRQLEVAETEEGLLFSLDWVGRKFDNQIEYLTRLRENRTRKSALLKRLIHKNKD